jgi:HK97 family phage major capsid protein
MHDYMRSKLSERESISETMVGIASKAAAEDRDLTDTERATVDQLQSRAVALDSQLAVLNEQAQSLRAFARFQQNAQEQDDDAPAGQLERRDGSQQLQTRSWGEIVAQDLVRSDRFQQWLEDGARGTSPRLQLPGILQQRAAADPIALTGLGGLEGIGRLVPYTQHELQYPTLPMLLQVVSREVVSTNTVEFIKWLPVPMPAAAKVAEGADKPAVDITANAITASLDTYAGWKSVTRQALEDFPRIQTIIEGKLRESLARAASNAVATGMNSAAAATATGAGSMSAAIRAAQGELQGKGYNPNAVALNPADWAAMDIAAQAAYSPGLGSGPTWGLTPVSSPDITAGSPVVGDFKAAITVFDRNQTDVFVTDSHGDNFIKNVLVILAEARFLVSVVDPSAMAKAVTGVAVP